MNATARLVPLGSADTAIAAALVISFHAGAIWALQISMPTPALQTMPTLVVAAFIAPAATAVPSPPTPPKPPSPVNAAKKSPPPTPAAAPPNAPAHHAATPTLAAHPALHTPADNPAPSPAAAPAPSATSQTAPSATPSATAAPPAPASVQLPSSNADYLQNPKPAYPPLSKRLGEQGKVIVRVLIAADGQPQKAELKQSSGFERLDQAALTTVMKWRYVPGKRGGVAEDMWFNVPINFVLE
jgi:protein TonB